MIVLSLVWLVWFAPCVQFSACFTWTEYPDSITRVWNSSTVALRWDYNLSVAEQTAAGLFISRFWKRGNESHQVQFASKDFTTGQPTKYVESLKPHITISRSEEATLIISDVTKEDEGFYEFTVQLLTLNNFFISRNTTVLVGVQPTLHCQSSVSIRKGEAAILQCSVTGDPKPNITWTKEAEPANIISYNSTLVIDNVCISDGGMYNVTAYNGRSASVLVTLTVTYPPENVSLTTNTTDKVCRGVAINFTCSAEANPPVHTYLLYENDTMVNNTGMLATWIKKVEQAGQLVFRCEANNSVQGIGKSSVTILTVNVPAVLEEAENKVVRIEGEIVEVYCNVTAGIPVPTVIWEKVKTGERIPTEGNLLNITNINREQAGEYRCKANNTCGEASTVVDIDVQYAPDRATLSTVPSNSTLLRDSIMTLNCTADANPEAEYHFYFNGESIGNSSSGLFNTTVMADGVYTCVPNNTVGEGDNATVDVTAVVPESNSILVTLIVTNKGCNDNPSEICEQIREKVEERIKEDVELEEPKSVTVKNCKCGSVTVYLSLDFTQNVKIPDVLSVLKKAAKGDGFGDLQVDPGSIRAISVEPLPTDPPSSTVGTTTSEDDKDKGMLWIIIGASVGGAIVLIIVVAVVAWCVHHKRKCRRKGSKVRCSESEAFAPEEDNDYGHVNNGYADKGPRPTEMEAMSQQQGASAVPTYAVVDKSAKKASKKDKKVEEEKPQAAPPEYAAVDKSKKKKKEEPEATYAEVDKSKKSKKQKPKPGEVLYADLNDFHQMQELPAVSTSPQVLPPIKKPTPYVETQYADITQFLKGDATLPESNNSQGPGIGTQAAPAPKNSNTQEPGTSTKETSQASNPGGDGGPGHETNF